MGKRRVNNQPRTMRQQFDRILIDRPAEGCWLWPRPPGNHGYGRGSNGSAGAVNYWLAHRASWEIHYGPIPDGLIVCHRCDVKLCVRPDHLFLGDYVDNAADMAAKERGTHVRLTEDDRLTIRLRWAAGERQVNLAQEYGVSQATISRIVRHADRYAR